MSIYKRIPVIVVVAILMLVAAACSVQRAACSVQRRRLPPLSPRMKPPRPSRRRHQSQSPSPSLFGATSVSPSSVTSLTPTRPALQSKTKSRSISTMERTEPSWRSITAPGCRTQLDSVSATR
jgi:hypothetical protein